MPFGTPLKVAQVLSKTKGKNPATPPASGAGVAAGTRGPVPSSPVGAAAALSGRRMRGAPAVKSPAAKIASGGSPWARMGRPNLATRFKTAGANVRSARRTPRMKKKLSR